MKNFLFLPLAFLFSSSAVHAADLASLDCVATNGVTIKSVGEAGDGMRVESQWGLFRKDFVAKVGTGADAEGTYINLDSENGHEYVIALDAKPARVRTQKSSGTIVQASNVRGIPDTFVAYISCEIRLR